MVGEFLVVAMVMVIWAVGLSLSTFLFCLSSVFTLSISAPMELVMMEMRHFLDNIMSLFSLVSAGSFRCQWVWTWARLDMGQLLPVLECKKYLFTWILEIY